jgi:peroxiredoxin
MTKGELLRLLADPGLAVAVYSTWPMKRSAWLIDRRGIVAHRWAVDRAFAKALPGLRWVATLWPAGVRIYRPDEPQRA